MTRPLPALTLAASLLAALPLDAAAGFAGRFGTRVNPVNPSVFEVIARTAGSGPDYWCGAGEYAERALGAGWDQPIYIVRGRGPSETTGRRSAVQFSLDPAAVGDPARGGVFMLNALRPGDSMSVQQAMSYCVRPPVRF